MNIKENKEAKALVARIQEKGSALKRDIATFRGLVKTGDGSKRLAAEIDELERLLLNCATSFRPAGEERQGIRECAKRIMFLLKEESGGMPSRKMRIAITGKNELPSVQLKRMLRTPKAGRQRRPSKD